MEFSILMTILTRPTILVIHTVIFLNIEKHFITFLLVDWVGLSIYYKGQVYSSTTGWSDNSNAPADQFDKLMNGVAGSETGTKGIPFGKFKFYDVYAKEKNKPFMVRNSTTIFISYNFVVRFLKPVLLSMKTLQQGMV